MHGLTDSQLRVRIHSSELTLGGPLKQVATRSAHYDRHATGFTRRLAGLRMLCGDCHRVKHLGRTLVKGGPPAAERSVVHLTWRNGWSREQARTHVAAVFAVFKERNAYTWLGTDLGWLVGTLGIRAEL